MNTGQTLLVIAAFALLSTLTLAINSTMITTSTMGLEMEASLNALSVAQTMLDEIMLKDFDENTTNNHRVFTYDGMTSVASLGPDAGEAISGIDSSRTGNFRSKTRFDDTDDYNRYVRWAWNSRLGWFIVRDSVTYVNELNPDNVSATRTWHKRITVIVSNFSMPKDLDGNVLPYSLQGLAIYRKYY